MKRIKKNYLVFHHLVVEGAEEAVVIINLAGIRRQVLLDLGRGVDLEEIHFLQVQETSGLRP